MDKIIVNAPALRKTGGLTILHQFIEAIPEDGIDYLVFIDDSISVVTTQKNIQLIPINVRSFVKRLIWDAFGAKKWLKENNINPLVAVSLQNTNFRINTSCRNYIYYHQPIPLYSYNWSLLKIKERSFWYYKHCYPFFVKLFINPKTEIFVQLEFIKTAFANKFNFPKNKIHVIFPKIELPALSESSNISIAKDKINIFYPAAPSVYKNHLILFKSLLIIDKALSKKLVLYLTNTSNEFQIQGVFKNIEIVFLGKLSHSEIVWLFNNVNALVFPSYIETLGLPLIEAAYFGLPIIAADLPYSREVLDGYKGVTYIDYQDAKGWGIAINSLCLSEKITFKPFKKENTKSWEYFFSKIKEGL